MANEHERGGSVKIPLHNVESINLDEPGERFEVSINLKRDKDGNRQCIHVISTDNVILINSDTLLIEC